MILVFMKLEINKKIRKWYEVGIRKTDKEKGRERGRNSKFIQLEIPFLIVLVSSLSTLYN